MAEDSLGKLHWQDILVITAYFLGVLIVGLWSARKANRSSISGYFLAGRSMHWIPVGASLFASNIGSGHFVGLAGSGAATGIGTAVFEFNALFVLLLLGWLFIPVYMASGVYTMPEYLKKRFGGQRIQIYLSVLALILYVFTKISADLFAGALFIEQSLELNMYIAIIILLAIAALFTITGGLTAVIWTDFVQTILMLVGAFILMFFSFNKVGGYEAVIDLYKTAEVDYLQNLSEAKQQCGRVKEDAMHLIRHPSSPDFPWTGVIFGLTVSAVWYWCSDQVIVQRALAAKNLTHAKAGTMLAGYLKILPLFILVFPGMIARILYKDIVACATPEKCKEACNNEGGCTNIAYATLVLDLMPNGLRGMMLAVMLAALMSSLTSIFNSSSTIFTMDIWTRIRKKASDTELLIVGRLFVLILVAISIIWIPVIKKSQGSQLFVYIQSITSYLSPPVCAVYVLAIFWTRTNEKGAFWSLMIGLCIGVIRFVLEFSFPTPPCGSEEIDSRPEFIKQAIDKVHYLHFGILLFIISAICCITISLLTKPIDEKHLHRLTFWSRHSTEVRVNIDEDTKEETTINSVSKECEEATDKQKSTDQLTTEETDESSVLKKLYYFICGIQRTTINSSEAPVKKLSREDEAREAAESLIEDPFWEKVCNINAVAVLMIAAFIWGYYA